MSPDAAEAQNFWTAARAIRHDIRRGATPDIYVIGEIEVISIMTDNATLRQRCAALLGELDERRKSTNVA